MSEEYDISVDADTIQVKQLIEYLGSCSKEYLDIFYNNLLDDPVFKSIQKSGISTEPIGIYTKDNDGKFMKIGEQRISNEYKW